jgi:uncharacterized membrane protein YidH (DUF202 family)
LAFAFLHFSTKDGTLTLVSEKLFLLLLSEKGKTMSLLFAQLMQADPTSPVSHLGSGLLASAVFGLVGIVLLLLGYWLFDLITPKIDVQKELAEKNMAVAVVIAALLLGIAYVAAHVVQ